MYPLRRAAARSAQQHFGRSSRRYASHGSHGHHHAEPVSEGFGPSFYVAFGAPILFYGLYQVTRTEGAFSKFIDQYTEKQDDYHRRVALHSAAIDQASLDRQLFEAEDKSGLSRGVDLRHPEQLNNGSPYNVSAGQTHANLDQLFAYYQEKHQKIEEDRLAKIKANGGKVVTVYDPNPSRSGGGLPS